MMDLDHLPMTALECLQALPNGRPCRYRTDSAIRMDQHQDLHEEGERGVIYDNCEVCGLPITLTKAGVLRIHGPRNNRCEGREGTFGR